MRCRKRKKTRMTKLKIKEAIVVEGRDDTAAVRKAVDGLIIETHGFGIKRETWDLIGKAYEEQGIIIFTDPDFSGEEIRRKITEKFPYAKQAFLSRSQALKKGDIGIENANPDDIKDALSKAHCTKDERDKLFTEEDLFKAGLTGRPDSKKRRQELGSMLAIGGGNAKALLNRLNSFNISREEFDETIRAIDNKGY